MKINLPIQSPAHIKEVKERLTRLFKREKLDRIPFLFDVGSPKYDEIEEKRLNLMVSRSISDHEYDLNRQLNDMQKYIDRPYKDDRILALSPYTGTGMVASAFGCKTHFFEDTHPWTEHIIQFPEDIDHLRPDIDRAQLFNLAIEKIRYFKEIVLDKIPIKLPDIQSPLDTAGIVMKDTELMMAMHTDSKRVHKLLDMITDVLIEMVHRITTEFVIPFAASHSNWLPYGIHMSDDYLSVVSPSIYEEFAVSYNERISKEFGGIFLHSCGDYTHNAKVLLKTKGLMGVDFHEFPMNKMADITGEDIIYNSGFLEDAFMTWTERMKSDNAILKSRAWSDFEKLPQVKNRRIYYNAMCYELERVDEYYNKLIEFTTIVARRE